MRVVLAPDSFKESMSAEVAAEAMRAGVLRAVPEAECVSAPLSDGGEGFVGALVAALGGQRVTLGVTGPLGPPVEASYGYVPDRALAIVEVAEAAGLGLVCPEGRDPTRATTRGVGEIILDALDRGARRLLVGLGGTGTNDAGAGMLSALGVVLTDAAGRVLPPGGAALADLATIDCAGLDPRLATVTVEVASDVLNPLTGPEGASQVFGRQKGASPEEIDVLDRALGNFASVARDQIGLDLADVPGAGAAGGLGAAFLGLLGARLERGIDVVVRAVGLAEVIGSADLVLTGEGSLDEQTSLGKAPHGVAQLAACHGVPVVGFAGRLGPGAERLLGQGFTSVIGILPGPCDLATACREGPANLERAVEMACRLLVTRVPGG